MFCAVCKAMRTSTAVIADVSTLNFNLMFEIGFCIGLEIPLLPIRDASYEINKRDFEELGLLDTLGYINFANATELATSLAARIPGSALPRSSSGLRRDQPLFIAKGAIQTEGELQLMTTVKKSKLRFKAHDPLETPRISLHEARRSVTGALGVITHLQSVHRAGYAVHNARAALVAGMAMAQQKALLMLQEEPVQQPIDYRDVVKSYSSVDAVPGIIEGFLRTVIDRLQEPEEAQLKVSRGILERLDLGDPAAENEIVGLQSYFVRTGPYTIARQGSTPLVVGMKGSGKTALFYGIRHSIGRAHKRFFLDLKPEGHQFKTLREAVLSKMTEGVREHSITAFWTYILLCELAHKIRGDDIEYSRQDPARHERYKAVANAYSRHDVGRDADFSQRLHRQVDRAAMRMQANGLPTAGDQVTELLYDGDIHDLANAVGQYLAERDEVWILIDNLDKGWPTRGASAEDIALIRGLLESARKLKRELSRLEVDIHYLVFIRLDIYDQLVREAPDKGKETCVRLDWNDREAFKQIFHARARRCLGERATFDDCWRATIDSHVGGVDSFEYIMDRTLMRPRHFLQFLRQAFQVAINRSHDRVQADDILQAERSYSEDLLLVTGFEIDDAHQELRDALYLFHGSKAILDVEDATILLLEKVEDEAGALRAIELLIWYGFLGVRSPGQLVARYAHDVQGNTRHLVSEAKRRDARVVINPAFHAALTVQ